ncbi:hypothetical protein ACFWJ4_32970 [Kitasatospora sp. NPDC127067]|uniref:hypothetical protein n=1 Tax=Kitasatospora sp. NPDC127067 TaxID=3347126 RepID=UPI0036498714
MSAHHCPLRTSAGPALRITVADLPGTAGTIRRGGKDDHDRRGRLEDTLVRAVKDGPPREIDLSHLLLRDSTRLDALLQARFGHLRCRDRPGLGRPVGSDQAPAGGHRHRQGFTVRDTVRAALADAGAPPAR